MGLSDESDSELEKQDLNGECSCAISVFQMSWSAISAIPNWADGNWSQKHLENNSLFRSIYLN